MWAMTVSQVQMIGSRVASGTSSPRDRLWREVFAPFADRADHVYIVDPYLAIDLYESVVGRGRRRRESGAGWFLAKLAESRVRTVHIASSAREVSNKRHDPAQVNEDLCGWFTDQVARTRVDLRLVTGNFVHGRRLAFDGWAGFHVDKGLATFDQPELTELLPLHASVDLADEVRREFAALCEGAG